MDESANTHKTFVASANERKRYRDIESVLLRAIADMTQQVVGELIGHDASYISRFLKGEKGKPPPQKMTVEEVIWMLVASRVVLISEDDLQELESRERLSKADYLYLLEVANKWHDHVRSQLAEQQ